MPRNPLLKGEPVSVVLTEWGHVEPANTPQLEDTSLRDKWRHKVWQTSLRSRVDVREGYRGLEVATTSFVGRIDVGPLRIAIQPKLPAMPLATLLRYAYGLRDLSTFDETHTPITRHGLHDLLIAMLADEVEELLHRGLARRYISLSEKLDSPGGRILIGDLVRQGGVTEARLPCQHFERRVNWQLNQVLRAGLGIAAPMTEDRELRRRVHRLTGMFGDVERIERLEIGNIDQAERALNRLTAANAPALAIIRLLKNMEGVAFESVAESIRTRGFLFDMNMFFQRLLLRFLSENLTGRQIKDEHAIGNVFVYSVHANPKARSAPRPRPDYALFHDNRLCCFLDAKYRDIWEKGFPPEWLYQLSIYALASPSQVSVLLYATMSNDARDERIEIRQPINWSSKGPASVMVRFRCQNWPNVSVLTKAIG